MKVSFTVVGSSMLFTISHAHMAMVEPRWNFGAADTSMCATEEKESEESSEKEKKGGGQGEVRHTRFQFSALSPEKQTEVMQKFSIHIFILLQLIQKKKVYLLHQ